MINFFPIVPPNCFLLRSISHFAELYSKKLGISADLLKKTLWGDYYLDAKNKRIRRGALVTSDSNLLWMLCFSCSHLIRLAAFPVEGQEAAFCGLHPGESVGRL